MPGVATRAGRTAGGLATGARFVASGLVVLPVSFSAFLLAVQVGVDAHLARVLSFVLGTGAVYVLNRRWTFRAPPDARSRTGFALLYTTTFVLVLTTYGLALEVLTGSGLGATWSAALGWVASQALGSTINVVVLRYAVFRPRP